MKKPQVQLLIISALFTFAFAQAAEVELIKARVGWEGSMPAKTHEGRIDVKEMNAEISGAETFERLEVVLDMTRIAVEDLKKGKDRKKLEGHLRSSDFFHVEEYPTATFVLAKHKAGVLHGTLKIRGVEEAAEIPVTLTRTEDGNYRLNGNFTFDRQKFNVNYQNSGFFGTAKDKIIRDEVKVSLDIVFAI
ncbi:MAG: YceI family protein [Kiritimatiellia bacterium]